MKARAVIQHSLGGPEVLRLEHVDVPSPGPGEVRICVKAFGFNRSEVMFREGRLQVLPVLPSRIGYEAAGIVESIGSGVEGLAPGDEVSTLPLMETNACGAYGEAFTVPADVVVKNPAGLDMAECAALWSSYITAYAGLVDLVTIRPGDFVLVTAASSSLGPPAIQIVKMLGAHPIAVTRRRSKAEAIRALGAADVIVTDEEDLVARVTSITGGKGAAVAFDPVGGPAVSELAQATAPYGTIILYGSLDSRPAPLPLYPIMLKNLSLHGLGMYLGDKPDRNRRAMDFIRDGIARGGLRPLIGKRFKLDQIVEAAEYFDSMEQMGKVVVEVD